MTLLDPPLPRNQRFGKSPIMCTVSAVYRSYYFTVCRVGGGGEGDLSSSDADSDSEDGSGQYEGCKSESGGGKVDPALNSAGSSDEVAQSKPSDEDDVGSSSHSDGGAKRVEGDMTPANGGGDGETGEQSEYSPAEEVSQKEGEATEQVESQDKKEVTQEKPVSTEPAKNDVSSSDII